MFFICLSKPLVPKTKQKKVLSAQVNFSFFNNRKAFEQKQTLNAKTLVAIKMAKRTTTTTFTKRIWDENQKKNKTLMPFLGCQNWDEKLKKTNRSTVFIWKLPFCLFVCLFPSEQ